MKSQTLYYDDELVFYKNLFILKASKFYYFIYNPLLHTSFRLQIESADTELDVDNNIQTLIDNDILTRDYVDSYEVCDYLINTVRYNNSVVTITDLSSYNCNLSCVYCMQQNTPMPSAALTPHERAQGWKVIKELFGANSINLSLFGGEPFFDPAFVEEMLLKSYDLGLVFDSISAVTNGTILNDKIVNMINIYPFTQLQITLDGLSNVHDKRRFFKKDKSKTFNVIVNNISILLKQTNVKIILNTVIDFTNINEYSRLIAYLKEVFTNYIFCDEPRIIFNIGNECNPFEICEFTSVNSLSNTNNFIKYYELYAEIFREGIPMIMFLPSIICIKDLPNEIILSPNGDLYSCITGVGHKDFHVCSIDDIIARPADAFASIVKSKRTRKGFGCYSCQYYGMCSGGCEYNKNNLHLETSCQKPFFDMCIKKIIEILSELEEIQPHVYRIRKNLNV
ncbi:MAG: SPASM domain-containing protein [Clostridiales bacterium]|jgi:uncharacterized protein|nr:SPASM domain-containing protein [Clostridiales bacterium]